jgi:hypothetical protein
VPVGSCRGPCKSVGPARMQRYDRCTTQRHTALQLEADSCRIRAAPRTFIPTPRCIVRRSKIVDGSAGAEAKCPSVGLTGTVTATGKARRARAHGRPAHGVCRSRGGAHSTQNSWRVLQPSMRRSSPSWGDIVRVSPTRTESPASCRVREPLAELGTQLGPRLGIQLLSRTGRRGFCPPLPG